MTLNQKYSCGICGHASKVIGSKRCVRAVRCVSCGFIWKDLASLPPDYYGKWKISTERNFNLRNQKEIFEYRLKTIIDKAGGKAEKILDFGCGRGEFVYFLREKGYEAYGCDTGPLTPEGPFFLKEDISRVKQSDFDVIIGIEVLEHLKDPKNIMAELSKRLRINGIIYIQTHYSFISRIFSWGYFDMENHVSFYGPSAMRRLMRLSGLELVHYDKKKVETYFLQEIRKRLVNLWCRIMPYSFKDYVKKRFDRPRIGRYENPPENDNYIEAVLKKLNCVYIGKKIRELENEKIS